MTDTQNPALDHFPEVLEKFSAHATVVLIVRYPDGDVHYAFSGSKGDAFIAVNDVNGTLTDTLHDRGGIAHPGRPGGGR